MEFFVLEPAENGTIEERVTFLEIQMDEVQGDLAQTEDEITLLFSQQIIQDDRLVNLEEDTDSLEGSVESKCQMFYNTSTEGVVI